MVKRLKKKSILILLAVCLLSNNVYAQNNDKDLITIKDDSKIELPKTKEDKEQSSSEDVGIIKIKENKNEAKESLPWTEEAKKVQDELFKVAKLQEAKDFELARIEMIKLLKKHSDYPFFWKWVAIYENKVGNYETSNDVFEKMFQTFFTDEKIKEDNLIKYYRIDNIFKIGKIEKAKAENEKYLETAEKEWKIIFEYQNMIINGVIDKEISEKKLNELWNQIPKEERSSLNNYYGVDISDVLYYYGLKYKRKDVLNLYVSSQENSKDANVIKKVQRAKEVIYDT